MSSSHGPTAAGSSGAAGPGPYRGARPHQEVLQEVPGGEALLHHGEVGFVQVPIHGQSATALVWSSSSRAEFLNMKLTGKKIIKYIFLKKGMLVAELQRLPQHLPAPRGASHPCVWATIPGESSLLRSSNPAPRLAAPARVKAGSRGRRRRNISTFLCSAELWFCTQQQLRHRGCSQQSHHRRGAAGLVMPGRVSSRCGIVRSARCCTGRRFPVVCQLLPSHHPALPATRAPREGRQP